MDEMIKFDMPKNQSSIIKVLGVGGGGSNAVNHMFRQGIRGVDFIICNTDAQAMEISPVPTRIQLGDRGLGAGSIPAVGKEAAKQKIDEIREILEKNTQMLFITAGMGGGTGTGAAPVIASIAKELNILTVGIVTLPFAFEGRRRRQQAEEGIRELRQYVDTLLIICNDKIRELHGDLKLSSAFGKADDVLTTAAKGIAEIITVTGYINVDFEDVKTVMKNSGKAIMGCAQAEGENRAMEAVKMALASPLLNDNEIEGASNVLLYITSGEEEISMDEVTEITDYIQKEARSQAEIIWGNGYDESLGKKINITLIATGFDAEKRSQAAQENIIRHHLNDEVPQEVTVVKPPAMEESRQLERIELITRKPAEEVKIEEPAEVMSETEVTAEAELDFLNRNPMKMPPSEPPVNRPEEMPNINSEPEPRSYSEPETTSYPEPEQKSYSEPEPMEQLKPDRTFVFEINQDAEEEAMEEVEEPIERFTDTINTELNGKEHPELEEVTSDDRKPFEVYIKTPPSELKERSITRPDRASLDLRSQERIERLRNLSMKLKSESQIEELENQPAYQRRNVDIDNTTPSSESQVSRYSLYDEDGSRIELRSGNSYLHDNVD
jgi:cell division protein FtsZ